MSTGTLLFYGGIAGIVIFSIVGIVTFVLLRGRGKKLLRAIQEEYE